MNRETKKLLTTLGSVQKHGKAKIITMTDADSFIKKRDRPERLNGLRKLTMQVVSVGYDYHKLVENRLKKEGIDPESFKKEDCKYSDKFSENGLVRVSKTNEDQFYFRYYLTKSVMEKEEVYINEANKVVKISEQDKEDWFVKKHGSQKQAEAGVSSEVQPRNIKFENIMYFQKGKALYSNLDETVLKLLNLEEVDD